MTLKELIRTIDRETLICVCDDLGPHTDIIKMKDVPLLSLMDELNRKVERIYIDDDGSLTIELENWKEEDYKE